MSAISPSVQAVLDLFEGPLQEVRFADVDAPALARLTQEVEASAAELAAQEAALETLRRNLAERQEQLLSVAQRALAYARVYAEADEALSAQLAAIQLPRPTRRPKEKTAPTKGESAADANATPPLPHAPAAEEPPVEQAASAASGESETETNARTPGSRRGKRREATRVVSLDDGSA